MSRKAFHQLLKRYLDGDCVQEEKEIVEQWYTQLRKNKHPELSTTQLDVTEQKIWTKIESGVSSLKWSEMVLEKALQPPGPSKRRITGLILFVLLVLAMTLLIYYYFSNTNPVDTVAPQRTMAAFRELIFTGIIV